MEDKKDAYSYASFLKGLESLQIEFKWHIFRDSQEIEHQECQMHGNNYIHAEEKKEQENSFSRLPGGMLPFSYYKQEEKSSDRNSEEK